MSSSSYLNGLWERDVSGRIPIVLLAATSRICLKQYAPSLYSFFFSPGVSLESKGCNHTIVLIQLNFGKIPALFYPTQLGEAIEYAQNIYAER